MRRGNGGVAVEHIVLLGPMGVGKTTIGAAVARQLGLPLLDSDGQIEALHGRSARAIAAADGVAALHSLEREALRAALDRPQRAVVAAAASVADDELVVAALAAHCCVWLRADAEVLAERQSSSAHRRSIGADELPGVSRRDRVYARLASVVIDTGEVAVEQAAAAIVATCDPRSSR